MIKILRLRGKSNGETEADVTEYLEGEVHVDNDIYK